MREKSPEHVGRERKDNSLRDTCYDDLKELRVKLLTLVLEGFESFDFLELCHHN